MQPTEHATIAPPAAPRADAAVAPASPASLDTRRAEESVKQTVISVIVAFILAFVFRAFVIEPFVIPTGSMAPTLLGAHTRFHSPVSGWTWSVTPRDYADPQQRIPLDVQGHRLRRAAPLLVTDPMSGLGHELADAPLRAGDRILVLKYLYAVAPPKRWDVVVFKSPEGPQENFIKRLIGLPGEQIRIADGDIFVRCAPRAGADGARWTIARKPARMQRALWQTLHSSEHAPAPETAQGAMWASPWLAPGWETDGAVFRAHSTSPGVIAWDTTSRDERGEPIWPLDDWVSYNDAPDLLHRPRYPVADLRLRASVLPSGAGLRAVATVEARHHQFEGALENGRAILRMRYAGPDAISDAPWTILADEPAPARALRPGRRTNVEFCHVDQALELWADGERLARAEYDWGAERRLSFAAGRPGDDGARFDTTDPRSYLRPQARWSFDGAPVELTRVGLDRDLAHQPSPTQLWFTVGEDQFFVMGDNSAASSDGRAWRAVDPWVGAQTHVGAGMVPRELMMGRAFFVYFPAPDRTLRGVPVPDFGRMRFIR